MEVRWDVFWIIMGSALLTFIPRVLPLMLFSKIQIPVWLLRWLEYVPVAVMAALIGQELFMSDNQLVPITQNAALWASLPTIAVAIWTRSLLGTVLVGIVAMMILRYWIG
ncbi:MULTISPECIES: AzlD domain-containing protein [Paenibacillus]|uniref:AzlD domain-containing protein n=1 Tax=Paenibacillus TaxID=44249 RepID=UPI000B83C37C|nr:MULTISPECIES: AzlD domain-containing protein [Paenibacillus]MBD8841206.1 AzlD domain-containing protein [Paenibacillus sp. CFBP 13594]MDQ0723125.1 branched-subunit amino acid transport protein [Paenibacillus sp. W4I10]MDR6720118.1 branched-subunit amino acid transport protein [Paenibacillus sp. 2003]PRA01807.1 AzlD domain-containing protein [Paenibacillus sp. MYb63]PRA44501.1 AzlD domain-containing protein [Paenibacillus sp. MYb67]